MSYSTLLINTINVGDKKLTVQVMLAKTPEDVDYLYAQRRNLKTLYEDSRRIGCCFWRRWIYVRVW